MDVLERYKAREYARRAFSNPAGSRCDPANTKLLVASNQYHSDCGYTAWCDPSDRTCKARGCRRDEYPFGFASIEHSKWPPRCDQHHFCPDEGSFCIPKQPLDSACQLNRDDQCSMTREHPEVKCLHNTCVAVNATLNQPCIYENVIYTFFTPTNTSAGSIISRDNCINGLYCNSSISRCADLKVKGSPCGSDKECWSGFCRDVNFVVGTPIDNDEAGVCSDPPFSTAQQHATWVYPAVIFVAVSLFLALLFALYQIHRWQAAKYHKEEEEYWEGQRAIVAEARALKETIRSMQETTDSQLRRRLPTPRANHDEGSKASAHLLTNLPKEVKQSFEALRRSRSTLHPLHALPPSNGPAVGREPRQRNARQPLEADKAVASLGIPLLPLRQVSIDGNCAVHEDEKQIL